MKTLFWVGTLLIVAGVLLTGLEVQGAAASFTFGFLCWFAAAMKWLWDALDT